MYTLKLKRNYLNIVMLALLLFSELAFYTIDTMNIYVGILMLATLYAGIVLLLNRTVFKSLMNSRCMWWIIIFYTFISVDAKIRGYGDFNYQRTLATLGVFICIWILLSDGRQNLVLENYCKACEIASLTGCTYIFINERESLLAFSRVGDTLSGNVNTVGVILSAFSLAIFYRYIISKNRRHLLIYVITVVFMLLTGSKKVFFSIIAAMLMYLFYGGFKFKRTVIIAVVISMFIYMIFNNEYLYNIIGARTVDFLGNIGFGINEYNYSHSTQSREDLIATAWELFRQRPIIGNGYGAVAKVSPYGYYSHNNMMELLACYGLVGFFLFYYRHIKSILLIRRKKITKGVSIFFIILIFNALLSDVAAVSYTATGAIPYIFLFVIDAYMRKQKRIIYREVEIWES